VGSRTPSRYQADTKPTKLHFFKVVSQGERSDVPVGLRELLVQSGQNLRRTPAAPSAQKQQSVHPIVDCYAADYCKEMSNDSYSKFMKRILTEENIASNHIVHLGRVLGSADLELLENEKDGTLDIGNWVVDVHKRS
jgi:hypothetical protein